MNSIEWFGWMEFDEFMNQMEWNKFNWAMGGLWTAVNEINWTMKWNWIVKLIEWAAAGGPAQGNQWMK